jgi:hypothetical protein
MLFAMRCLPRLIVAGGFALIGWKDPLWAAELPVVNSSFELPVTDSSDVRIESWQKFPQPDWFVETPGQTWDQLAGTFRVVPPAALENVDGAQAAYIFALPEVGIYQDLASNGSALTFLPGTAYQARFGVVGGGSNMKPEATLAAVIYYNDSNGNQVRVAQTTVTNSATLFPTQTHLVDFTVDVPVVGVADAWAGKQMGILFVSTVSAELAGGSWTLDNVRILTIPPDVTPRLTAARQGNNLRVSWESVAGRRYQLQATSDLQTWANRGEEVLGTGTELSQILPLNEWRYLYLRLQELPQ